MKSIIFSMILFTVISLCSIEIEEGSLEDLIYNKMPVIHNKGKTDLISYSLFKDSVGVATPLQYCKLHEKDTITEKKTFEFFKKKSRDAFKDFAHTMAQRDNKQENAYTLLSKRIVANYLHDIGIQEVQEPCIYVSNKDKNSEYVKFGLQALSEIDVKSEIKLEKKETDSDILLNKFVQKYHTSVTCPELISADKYTFALSNVGIRSLENLEELVSSQLVDVDFTGAQLGNNFYIRSTYPAHKQNISARYYNKKQNNSFA